MPRPCSRACEAWARVCSDGAARARRLLEAAEIELALDAGEAAEAHLRASLAADPAEPRAHQLLVERLAGTNRAPEVLAQSELALAAIPTGRPERTAIALQRGRAFESAGELERASETYRLARETDPRSTEACLAQARLLRDADLPGRTALPRELPARAPGARGPQPGAGLPGAGPPAGRCARGSRPRGGLLRARRRPGADLQRGPAAAGTAARAAARPLARCARAPPRAARREPAAARPARGTDGDRASPRRRGCRRAGIRRAARARPGRRAGRAGDRRRCAAAAAADRPRLASRVAPGGAAARGRTRREGCPRSRRAEPGGAGRGARRRPRARDRRPPTPIPGRRAARRGGLRLPHRAARPGGGPDGRRAALPADRGAQPLAARPGGCGGRPGGHAPRRQGQAILQGLGFWARRRLQQALEGVRPAEVAQVDFAAWRAALRARAAAAALDRSGADLEIALHVLGESAERRPISRPRSGGDWRAALNASLAARLLVARIAALWCARLAGP